MAWSRWRWLPSRRSAAPPPSDAREVLPEQPSVEAAEGAAAEGAAAEGAAAEGAAAEGVVELRCRVDANLQCHIGGRAALSRLALLRYDARADESLLRAAAVGPGVEGQLRAHLQWLGFCQVGTSLLRLQGPLPLA